MNECLQGTGLQWLTDPRGSKPTISCSENPSNWIFSLCSRRSQIIGWDYPHKYATEDASLRRSVPEASSIWTISFCWSGQEQFDTIRACRLDYLIYWQFSINLHDDDDGGGVGTNSHQGSKQPKDSDQTYVCPRRRQISSKVGLVTGGVTDSILVTVQAANRVNQECKTSSHNNTLSKQQIGDKATPAV